MNITDWSIAGSGGEPIFGNTHSPLQAARGVAIIAHGFKGYKDYGMFPWLARRFAEAGLLVHRFNFSHAGMTNNVKTFERPDLFACDTWNKQVFDLRAVISSIANGTLAGSGLPFFLFGHSRGGVTCLLTAGRCADDAMTPHPTGVITASSPSFANNLSDDEQERLLREGFIVSPSSRTGQDLRVGLVWLDEQRSDPAAHDLLTLTGRIRCPVLIIHGDQDPTVPVTCAAALAGANRRAQVVIIPGADHVFNTPNPFGDDESPSAPLRDLRTAAVDFMTKRLED